MIELSPQAPVFLLLAFSEIALGSYVLIKGRSSLVNRHFFLLSLLAGVGNLLDLTVASMVSEEQALWTFRTLVFLLIMEIGVAYRLSTLVPHPMPLTIYGRNLLAYWLAVFGVSLVTTMSVRGLVKDEYGWVPANDQPVIMLMILLGIYILLLATTFARRWRGLKGLMKRQVIIFTTALAIPALVMMGIMAIEATGVVAPRIYVFGELASMVILAYGILRYQLMVPPRVLEPAVAHRPVPALIKGRAYLFEFTSPDRMFESVAQEMAGGMSALLIARTHPEQIRVKYQLMHTPIMWLAEAPGPDRVDPSNLQLLAHMIMGYVRKGPSVIALEGLEYIILNNDLNKVLRFLGQLRDEVIVEGSILLISVDPRTLTERQRAIMERELEVVKE